MTGRSTRTKRCMTGWTVEYSMHIPVTTLGGTTRCPFQHPPASQSGDEGAFEPIKKRKRPKETMPWYLWLPDIPSDIYPCCECGCFQCLDAYYSNRSKTNGYDTICKDCSNYIRRLRHRLRKNHPPPSDHVCDFCGRYSKSLHLEHSHETDLHRGWACLKCNRARRTYTPKYTRRWPRN